MRHLSAAFLLALWLPAHAVPPVVSNVTAAQRPGTKLVDVTYDLADPDTAALTVSLQVSSDGGSTWTVPAAGNTGHVGSGVLRGLRKIATWNAGANWNNQFSTTMRFRITAADGTGNAPPDFSLIPAGQFQMGDPFAEGWGVLPMHSVTLSAFYMGKTEVQYSQWQITYTWALANGYNFDNTGQGLAATHPVSALNWYDVVKWCNARSQQENLLPCYLVNGTAFKVGQQTPTCDFTRNGYRLPTEAEWEYAARGGLAFNRFPWGDTISHNEANFRNNGGESYQFGTTGYHPSYINAGFPYTSPVGSFPPTGYDLHDVAGNVEEWCWDVAEAYSSAAVINPTGPNGNAGDSRIVRGGAAALDAVFCRVAGRNGGGPSSRDWFGGFRLALSRTGVSSPWTSIPAIGTDAAAVGSSGYTLRTAAISVGGLATFAVRRPDGLNFLQNGRAQIREGNRLTGTVVAEQDYLQGAPGPLTLTVPLGFITGSRQYYVSRRDPVSGNVDPNQWDGPVTITATSSGGGTHSANSLNTVLDTRDPSVSNVLLTANEDTGRIEIRYDLGNVPLYGAQVRVEISLDGGVTWQTAETLTGAVGGVAAGGSSLRAFWDPAADAPTATSVLLKGRVSTSSAGGPEVAATSPAESFDLDALRTPIQRVHLCFDETAPMRLVKQSVRRPNGSTGEDFLLERVTATTPFASVDSGVRNQIRTNLQGIFNRARIGKVRILIASRSEKAINVFFCPRDLPDKYGVAYTPRTTLPDRFNGNPEGYVIVYYDAGYPTNSIYAHPNLLADTAAHEIGHCLGCFHINPGTACHLCTMDYQSCDHAGEDPATPTEFNSGVFPVWDFPNNRAYASGVTHSERYHLRRWVMGYSYERITNPPAPVGSPGTELEFAL